MVDVYDSPVRVKTKGYEPYQAEQFVRQTDDSRNGLSWFGKKHWRILSHLVILQDIFQNHLVLLSCFYLRTDAKSNVKFCV